ncbi:D-aminoacyl-tRNA deacylase [Robbsia sp. Bb-Pol-6]|uniref:D-aminoacyl-tRNA deacylase n=1 Tax=Robbsia betulipollinis TaxID=2981849 RepID=A0ABT3ZLE2_9BURK|nr:D-aminoacyl-tRNA deacylase [Robbsia betulipollinis]MCY0387354.1 D-aminoacyl-tRNA deacylase [Robbsia betulipollinis]
MIGLVQRVTRAEVDIDGRRVGAIEAGLLALVCAERGDTPETAARLAAKLLGYRVFGDAAGKMNRSVQDLDGAGTPGGVLLVPQFTLAADTRSGSRPSFSGAATPELARVLFDGFVAEVRARHAQVSTGVFGAHMQVALVNDGPVTFWLRIPPAA